MIYCKHAPTNAYRQIIIIIIIIITIIIRIKEIYEVQAGEIRKNISIAAAEIERLRANRKLTSKGKKIRAKLLKNCKSLSVADLVVYMEKEKTKVRELKRNFWRVKRLEEARKPNQKFYLDPGNIYATFGKMLESHADIDKPKYDRVTQGKHVNNYTRSPTLTRRVVFGKVYGKKNRAETRKQNGSRRLERQWKT